MSPLAAQHQQQVACGIKGTSRRATVFWLIAIGPLGRCILLGAAVADAAVNNSSAATTLGYAYVTVDLEGYRSGAI